MSKSLPTLSSAQETTLCWTLFYSAQSVEERHSSLIHATLANGICAFNASLIGALISMPTLMSISIQMLRSNKKSKKNPPKMEDSLVISAKDQLDTEKLETEAQKLSAFHARQLDIYSHTTAKTVISTFVNHVLRK